jgi:hypothetical protein
MRRLAYILSFSIVLSLFVSSCHDESEEMEELNTVKKIELTSEKKKKKKITYISSEKKIRTASGEYPVSLICKAELSDFTLNITFEGCMEDATITIINNLNNEKILERPKGTVNDDVSITIRKSSFYNSFYIKVESPMEILQGNISYD